MTLHRNNSTHRILIIDDNHAIHQDFCKILIKAQRTNDALNDLESELFNSKSNPAPCGTFKIDSAFQGKEGLRLVQKARSEGNPYSLAFVDGRMPPGWDGIETINHLWQESPDLQVVLCTAYSDYTWHDIHSVLGETNNLLILKKPFDNVEVRQLAHALTRKWTLTRNAQCQIDSLNGMVQQKTREKKQVGALLEAALEHSQAGIIISDAKSTAIRWINPAALRILDQEHLICSKQGLVNHNLDWRSLCSDDMQYAPGELPLLRATTNGETIQNEEFIICDAKGHKKWISFNAAPVRGPDQIISAGILVFQDVTQSKSIEAQLYQARKMESVGTMAAGIAHDFNNMLYIITGNVELAMVETAEQHPVHANLKEIKSAALRAANVIKQLLNFSRKAVPRLQPVNAVDVVQDSLGFLRATIPTSIGIHKQLPNTDITIQGDLTQLNQIMMNLCINAFQAMEENGGTLDIIVEKVIPSEDSTLSYTGIGPGEWLKIRLSDTGPGIPPDIIDCVFDPYFTTKDIGKGSGMGLAVVQGIVRNHNGFIFLDSKPDEGTTFTLFFKVIKENVPVQTKPPETVCRGNGERILIVDDEKSIVEMVGMMLERLGYVVESTTNPVDALERFISKPEAFDMVLSDMTMPQMTGIKLSQKLKEVRPDIPIIICSGRDLPIDGETAKISSVDGYVMKPIVMKQISRAIRKLLNGTRRSTP